MTEETPPPHGTFSALLASQKPQHKEPAVAPQPATRRRATRASRFSARQADSNIASNLASFLDDAIDQLREPAHISQTFRFSEREVEWLTETAAALTKKMERRKRVTKAEIVRIAFQLFEKTMQQHPDDVIAVLHEI